MVTILSRHIVPETIERRCTWAAGFIVLAACTAQILWALPLVGVAAMALALVAIGVLQFPLPRLAALLSLLVLIFSVGPVNGQLIFVTTGNNTVGVFNPTNGSGNLNFIAGGQGISNPFGIG